MNALELKLSHHNRKLVESCLKFDGDLELAIQQLPQHLQDAIQQWVDSLYYSENQPADPYKDALEALLT